MTSPEETDPRHTPGEASLWVEALARGNAGAESQLLDLVYAELRRLANSFLQRVPLATEFAESIRGDGAEVWTQIGLLTLDEGLEVLAQRSRRAARIVELRFFAGMTEKEVAEVVGIAPSTVTLEWRAARAWLSNWMKCGDDE